VRGPEGGAVGVDVESTDVPGNVLELAARWFSVRRPVPWSVS
jgi:hypothetical protein